MSLTLANSLALVNDVLQAAIVIFGAGVILYNVPHWVGDRVTRAFSNLVFFVVVVYFSELLVSRTQLPVSAEYILRSGWLGIAFVPAAQFHLSDALLVTTGYFSKRRRLAVRGFYLLGLALFAMTVFSDTITMGLVDIPHVPHLQRGPLFPLFVLFFLGTTGISIYNVFRARQRCVTRTTRQRMTTILTAFLAAPLAVFPYQLLVGDASVSLPIWLLLISGNLIVGIMFALLTYYLAYFGQVSPDRVVRVRLFKFMARVPMTATIALSVYILVGRASPLLGLPSETMRAIALVLTVMFVEWSIHQFKQPLERFL